MILIISRDSESTTDLVIDWLIKWEIPFIRINDELYNDVYVDFQTNTLMIQGIDIKAFTVVWFRKHSSSIDEITRNYLTKNISKSFNSFHSYEASAFRQFFFAELKKYKHIKWLTSPFFSTENKLLQMKIAQECGLLIPESYVLTSKKDLIKIIRLHSGKDLITKPFENCRHLKVNREFIHMRTTIVNRYIDNIPDFFPPALIQKRVEKKYELRIFYLTNKFFTTRIVDENRDEVDHRVNALHFNCRYEVYSLPESIEIPLQKLLQHLDLNCASIDMIIDNNDNYIFLEVNATGQFTYHSVFNNTYLDKEVALSLKKLHESHEK
ncbi:hypothetical protein KRE40_10085 [Elizabethkingia meningoseptica]|uniref:hypothetical protein n=1 Tax=Elizabethkingia meningoseptica TaxID=238 RepID=UPI0023B05C3E|nr:hypothetical protein [Elizabethkingia meningoseptica]MDE5436977.1 hypothetical protein [Elizabethkingia meningoseptica]MDE5449426.1 hypothetical protein [Elizabethkingia meningoseptica]MDE5508996.1 hypothetical protein [Elizabethkingia meningoseptica]MDE5514513.1 hypothetical protein [Elizabethkingia meningoseptica]MDE5525159.1 hypothetical protein [Elizabethkingia meningoseptica]